MPAPVSTQPPIRLGRQMSCPLAARHASTATGTSWGGGASAISGGGTGDSDGGAVMASRDIVRTSRHESAAPRDVCVPNLFMTRPSVAKQHREREAIFGPHEIGGPALHRRAWRALIAIRWGD